MLLGYDVELLSAGFIVTCKNMETGEDVRVLLPPEVLRRMGEIMGKKVAEAGKKALRKNG